MAVSPSCWDPSLLPAQLQVAPIPILSVLSSEDWTVLNFTLSTLILLPSLSTQIYWFSPMIYFAVPHVGPRFSSQTLVRATSSAQNALPAPSTAPNLLLCWLIHRFPARLSCTPSFLLPLGLQRSAGCSHLIFVGCTAGAVPSKFQLMELITGSLGVIRRLGGRRNIKKKRRQVGQMSYGSLDHTTLNSVRRKRGLCQQVFPVQLQLARQTQVRLSKLQITGHIYNNSDKE